VRHRLFAALAVLALLVAGCSRPTRAVAPPPDVAPEPDSPQNVLRRFEWAVDHRDLRAIAELVAADFVFLSAGMDSAGSPTTEIVHRRDDLLAWLRELLIGSPEQPPASDVTFRFDESLVPLPDPRPGYPDSLFKSIRTSLDMTIEWDDGMIEEMTGHALFHLGRGDAVLIPDELLALGIQRDRNRWWMSRWTDETIASADPLLVAAPSASPPVRMPGEVVPE
jgi:hypothetical protein